MYGDGDDWWRGLFANKAFLAEGVPLPSNAVAPFWRTSTVRRGYTDNYANNRGAHIAVGWKILKRWFGACDGTAQLRCSGAWQSSER